jgi:hypothetical protein
MLLLVMTITFFLRIRYFFTCPFLSIGVQGHTTIYTSKYRSKSTNIQGALRTTPLGGPNQKEKAENKVGKQHLLLFF